MSASQLVAKAGAGGGVLRTSLDNSKEAQLREALAGAVVQAAPQAQPA